jgi:hypothetical protein
VEVVVDLKGKLLFNQGKVVERGEKVFVEQRDSSLPHPFSYLSLLSGWVGFSSDLADSSGAKVLHNSGVCNGCITKGFCFYKLSLHEKTNII